MENDADLLAFNTWRVTQPDADTSGEVFSANDHGSKSCSVWWAGPRTDLLDRMRAEAARRGITLLAKEAPYSVSQIQQVADAIFDHREQLERLHFDLQGVSGPNHRFLGFRVQGAPLGDDQSQGLPSATAALVHVAVSEWLRAFGVRSDDVRVEYGRWHRLNKRTR